MRFTQQIRSFAATLLFILLLSFSANAQQPCTMTGNLLDQNLQPLKNTDVNVTVLAVNGIQASGEEKTYRSHPTTGVVTFIVPQGAQIRVSSIVVPFNKRGKVLTVPNSATAMLEALAPLASIPTQGLTVKDEGSPLPTLIGTFNFVGAGVTVTQPPTGIETITITGGGSGGALDLQ